MQTTGPHYTGYVYDGEGRRVAKGNVNSLSCDMATNGFAVTNGYILGLGGEQVSETNGSGTWLHTNVFAGGKLLATYSGSDTYFALNDWLGTKRAQYSASAGGLTTFATLPFGDNLTQTGGGPDATEHHFTGKEHDAESGLDYFTARYYGSSMGHFLSPDWSAKQDPIPYAKLDDPQSLNLYSYVQNNPLGTVDQDGHCARSGWCDINGTPYQTDSEKAVAMKQAQQHTNSGRDPAFDLAADGLSLVASRQTTGWSSRCSGRCGVAALTPCQSCIHGQRGPGYNSSI